MAIDENDRVVMFRIPRLYRSGMSDAELYEATRKWWVMNPDRHDCDWAFSVVGGKVLAVYRIDNWEPHPESGRWAFRGSRDAGMERRYVGADVTEYLPQGFAGPVRYVNC